MSEGLRAALGMGMMRMRGGPPRTMQVIGAEQLTPRMRRVSMTVDDLDGFDPKPGQDMALMLPDARGELGRRHYSIRHFDRQAGRVDFDVFLHSDSTPGARFALQAPSGGTITGFGPRGRNVIQPGADVRVFSGDETAIGPIFAMLESLPAGSKAVAFIEVTDDGERQPIETAADLSLEWLSRGGQAPAPSSAALIGALAAFSPPAGIGHYYLLGETSTIRRQRHDLLARGVDKSQIFGEGYWRPGRVGGHDHLDH